MEKYPGGTQVYSAVKLGDVITCLSEKQRFGCCVCNHNNIFACAGTSIITTYHRWTFSGKCLLINGLTI